MTALEDSQIIALFYERSEQAIAELDRKYGADGSITAAQLEAIADSFDFSIL